MKNSGNWFSFFMHIDFRRTTMIGACVWCRKIGQLNGPNGQLNICVHYKNCRISNMEQVLGKNSYVKEEENNRKFVFLSLVFRAIYASAYVALYCVNEEQTYYYYFPFVRSYDRFTSLTSLYLSAWLYVTYVYETTWAFSTRIDVSLSLTYSSFHACIYIYTHMERNEKTYKIKM